MLCLQMCVVKNFTSILTKTEMLLSRNEALSRLLEEMAGPEYRDVIDGALGLLMPQFQVHIKAYYADKGPLLKDMYNKRAIKDIDLKLYKAIEQMVLIQDQCGEMAGEVIRLAISTEGKVS